MSHDPDRLPDGRLLLSLQLHVTYSKPGTTHGAHAYHVSVDGLSACSGVVLATEHRSPLNGVHVGLRCRRAACKRIWSSEVEVAPDGARMRRDQ